MPSLMGGFWRRPTVVRSANGMCKLRACWAWKSRPTISITPPSCCEIGDLTLGSIKISGDISIGELCSVRYCPRHVVASWGQTHGRNLTSLLFKGSRPHMQESAQFSTYWGGLFKHSFFFTSSDCTKTDKACRRQSFFDVVASLGPILGGLWLSKREGRIYQFQLCQ